VNHLTKPETPDRTKIDVQSPAELKHWAHALGITEGQVQFLVEKVGNSAAAVKKELETLRQIEAPRNSNLPWHDQDQKPMARQKAHSKQY
jgi:Protein of unknown function (DUF3606)